MNQTRFDQAARRLARLDPQGFFAWLITKFAKYLRFCGWLDTRTTPGLVQPSEQTGDTVAELEALDEPAPPWMFPQEFQTQPDPDMFGRMLRQGGQMWLDHRPDRLPGSRFQLAMGVVNLTGTCASLPGSRRYKLPGEDEVLTDLSLRERWLAEESGADLLDRVERGEVGRYLPAFVPLMKDGGDPVILQRWLQLVGADADHVRRTEIASLALVFAELKDWHPAWKNALKEWKMRESQTVLEWINEGKLEGKVETLQEMLRKLLEARFGPLSGDLIATIEAESDIKKLEDLVIQVVRISNLEDLAI